MRPYECFRNKTHSNETRLIRMSLIRMSFGARETRVVSESRMVSETGIETKFESCVAYMCPYECFRNRNRLRSMCCVHFRVVIISHKLSLLRFSRLPRLFCSLAFSLFVLLSLSLAHTRSRTYMCVRVRVHVCVRARMCARV